MLIRAFEWDDANTEHVRRHRVDQDEVEEAFAGKHRLFRTRDGRYALLGRSAVGRYLFVVFEYHGGGLVRAITARDMTFGETRLYRRKK
jgi:uncharacterized DUF497 family protein